VRRERGRRSLQSFPVALIKPQTAAALFRQGDFKLPAHRCPRRPAVRILKHILPAGDYTLQIHRNAFLPAFLPAEGQNRPFVGDGVVELPDTKIIGLKTPRSGEADPLKKKIIDRSASAFSVPPRGRIRDGLFFRPGGQDGKAVAQERNQGDHNEQRGARERDGLQGAVLPLKALRGF